MDGVAQLLAPLDGVARKIRLLNKSIDMRILGTLKELHLKERVRLPFACTHEAEETY